MTIKQIAQSLGVSTATVSNVIHGHLEKMSPETAKRIQEKLSEYQYIPNMNARILAKGTSEIIGIIYQYRNREKMWALQDPFVSEIIGSLENAIRSRGYFTVLHVAQDIWEAYRVAQTWNVAGLITIGMGPEQGCKLMEISPVPVVFIDCYVEKNAQCSNVITDYRQGMYLMTKYLLSLGHRDILYINDQNLTAGIDTDRLSGHIDALAEEGVSWDEDRYFIISKERKSRLGDYDKLIQHLKNRKDTAWMFVSDYYAVEAMDYMLDHGIMVPDDISITGFDDNILSKTVRPRLTTIHQDISQKGTIAVRALAKLIENGDLEAQTALLPVRLIKGQSTRRI